MSTIFDTLTDALLDQLASGRTQAELAQELGLHQTTISTIARGERRLGRNAFEAMLHTRPPWLLPILTAHRLLDPEHGQ